MKHSTPVASFNNKGELNANSKRDAYTQIASYLQKLGEGYIDPDEQEEAFYTKDEQREIVEQAFVNPEKRAELGIQIAGEVQASLEREGFTRRVLNYQETSDGEIISIDIEEKGVVVVVSNDPGSVYTQFIGSENSRTVIPEEYYITARPYMEKRLMVTKKKDPVQKLFNDALEAIMVGEDKIWKMMADASAQYNNQMTTLVGGLTMAGLSGLIDYISGAQLTPGSILVDSTTYSGLLTSADFRANSDPITSREVLQTGNFAMLYGTQVITDGVRLKSLQVLDPGDVYVMALPEQAGVYTDRGGVESEMLSIATEKVPGKGWVLNEMFSASIVNTRAIAKAQVK
jgi:hypothetical protein